MRTVTGLLAIGMTLHGGPREEDVRKLFAHNVTSELPGCAYAVTRDGVMLVKGGAGIANLEYRLPITTRTSFYLASLSKPFTAAAVLALEKQGKLSLADSIRKWLPELPAYTAPVTVLHLLNHRGGIRDPMSLAEIAGRRGAAAEDELWRRQKSLDFEPGAYFVYSNLGYELLGQIVAKASGKTLAEYAKEAVFDPLGMRRTAFYPDRNAVVPYRATGYSAGQDGRFRVDGVERDSVGDGGAYSTIEDLLLWSRWLETSGGPQSKVRSAGVEDYALGLYLNGYRGLPTVGHTGILAGYRVDMLRFIDDKLAVICLCNHSGADAHSMTRRIAEIYLGAKMHPHIAVDGGTEPPKDLTPYTGSFASEEVGQRFDFAAEGGKLILRSRQGWRMELTWRGDDTFGVGPWQFHFEKGAGRIRMERDGRIRNLVFLAAPR